MKKVFALLFAIYTINLSAQSKVDFFPATPNYSSTISTFKGDFIPQGYTLAAVSLQGLVNRDSARIFIKERQSEHLLDMHVNDGLVTTVNDFADVYQLLRNYKDFYVGAVVYDPQKSFTINLATNIAGVENRIIISPDMIDNFEGYTGKTDIVDLRDNNFASLYDAYEWYETNILPLQINDVLAVANDGFMHDIYRDYMIAFKIPTFWLPGPTDHDYDEDYENKIKELFINTPVNIPVLGFWPDANAHGYEEYHGVKLAGYYGKFTVVNTWVGNYSFFTAFKHDYTYFQQKVRQKSFQEYDSTKKYVALIMIESGDSPGYMQYGLSPRQWDDPYRGQVAINYSLNSSQRMLLPQYTKYLYETATENDFFFSSISGAGYCYPFEGYGSLTSNPSSTMTDYFGQTSDNMKLMDWEMMGLYTHPSINNGKWTSEDIETFTNYIEPMRGLQAVISSMHRNGYTGADGNAHYNNYGNDITVHHTLTFWPTTNYQWDDTTQDQVAVNFMINEIKTYGAGGNFTQAMFYSWMYSARRLKMLQDQMADDGYVFVTLNEFDHLYRISENLSLEIGVEESKKASLKYYPNPVDDSLNFMNAINGKINLYNINGKMLKQIEGANIKSFDFEGMQPGLYILNVEHDSGEENSIRVIKN